MTSSLVLAAATLFAFGCKDKTSTATTPANAIAKMTEFRDQMCKCKDAACAKDVSDRMMAWSQEQSKSGNATSKMSDAEQKRAEALGEEMGKCMNAAMSAAGSGTAAATADTQGSGAAGSAAYAPGELPPECNEYKAAIDKLAGCNAINATAREQLVKTYEQAAAGWAKLDTESKHGLKVTCKSAADAVLAAAKQPCGW